MAAQPNASQTLKSVVVLEKDVNGDVLTWSFPSIDKTLETVLKNRSGLVDSIANTPTSSTTTTPSVSLSSSLATGLIETPFRFSRFQNSWLYIYSVALDTPAAKSKKVTAVSIGIVTNAYNPPKYQDLCKIFLKAYSEGESPLSPIPVMQIYLGILTTNKYAGPFGTFDDASYDSRRAMIAPLKFLITTFGAESILIWIGMLLKKRIVVYHPRLNEVQNLVKIFPLLGAWHRQDLSMLRPFVNVSSELELQELVRAGVFVAGVTDSTTVSRKDLYDLYIDVPAKTFTFGQQSSSSSSNTSVDGRPSDFNLTKFHRTTLETFLKAAETENDQGVIKVVAQQTKEFLDKLATLKSEDPSGAITQEGLQAAGLPAAMQNWIYSVATAEGLTKK